MSRIRTIKPEFPQSESMGRVGREARLCFVLLWTLADDHGRLRGHSRMLASLLYPYDEDASGLIDGWLGELERENCIERYVVDGAHYVAITNWLIHQKIDRPSKPRWPTPIEGSRGLANAREASSLDQGPRTKDQGRDQGVEGSARLSSVGGQPALPALLDFHALAANAFLDADDVDLAVEAWNELAVDCDLPEARKISDARRSKAKARLRDCGGLDGWYVAIEKVRGIPGLLGKNDRGWKADFDFLLSEKKFIKLMEGGYDHWGAANAKSGTGVTSALMELADFGSGEAA